MFDDLLAEQRQDYEGKELKSQKGILPSLKKGSNPDELHVIDISTAFSLIAGSAWSLGRFSYRWMVD
jgi:hypothetical protein